MNQPANNPRGKWTSASNAQADALCPGRHLAQAAMPEGDGEGEYASIGRKIHAALAAYTVGDRKANRPLTDRLSLQERETYEACLEMQREIVAKYFTKDQDPNFHEFREQRYWARFQAGGAEYQHSGQVDYLARMAMSILILDYKVLLGEVAESPKNMQLRDLACLAAGNFIPTEEVAVAIIQPHVTRSPEICVYSKEDLARATKEMFERVFQSNQPNAKRVAGEMQCKFCRAKAGCKEYQQWAGKLVPAVAAPLISVPMASWNVEQCVLAANSIGPAQKFLDDIKEMLKERLAKDPESVPGWELKPGSVREKITNPQGVFDRFSTLGGKIERFMPCVEVGKTKLREALHELTGAKGKALDAAMKTLTDGMVEAKQAEPSLKRKDNEQ